MVSTRFDDVLFISTGRQGFIADCTGTRIKKSAKGIVSNP